MRNKALISLIGVVATILLVVAMATRVQSESSANSSESQVLLKTYERIPYDIETWSSMYDVIAVGTITSVKYEVVDESYNSTNTSSGDPLYYEVKTPYHFVTIEVQKYLKDNTGSNAAQLTFKAETDGTILLNGIQTYVKIEGRGDYSLGEKAIFFLANLKKGLSCDGYMSKFDIDADGNAISKYLREKGDKAQSQSVMEQDIVATVNNLKDGMLVSR